MTSAFHEDFEVEARFLVDDSKKLEIETRLIIGSKVQRRAIVPKLQVNVLFDNLNDASIACRLRWEGRVDRRTKDGRGFFPNSVRFTMKKHSDSFYEETGNNTGIRKRLEKEIIYDAAPVLAIDLLNFLGHREKHRYEALQTENWESKISSCVLSVNFRKIPEIGWVFEIEATRTLSVDFWKHKHELYSLTQVVERCVNDLGLSLNDATTENMGQIYCRLRNKSKPPRQLIFDNIEEIL